MSFVFVFFSLKKKKRTSFLRMNATGEFRKEKEPCRTTYQRLLAACNIHTSVFLSYLQAIEYKRIWTNSQRRTAKLTAKLLLEPYIHTCSLCYIFPWRSFFFYMKIRNNKSTSNRAALTNALSAPKNDPDVISLSALYTPEPVSSPRKTTLIWHTRPNTLERQGPKHLD